MSDQATKAKPTKKEFKFSKRSRENMKGVNPILIELVERALKKSKYDFGILETGGFRTQEMQSELFQKGVSKCDGWDRISAHQLGNAIDPIPYVGGKFTWNNQKAFEGIHEAVMEAWKEMNIKGVQLIWGGNWKNFYDPAHYQIRAKR